MPASCCQSENFFGIQGFFRSCGSPGYWSGVSHRGLPGIMVLPGWVPENPLMYYRQTHDGEIIFPGRIAKIEGFMANGGYCVRIFRPLSACPPGALQSPICIRMVSGMPETQIYPDHGGPNPAILRGYFAIKTNLIRFFEGPKIRTFYGVFRQAKTAIGAR
jgi:hypothetical protein